MRENAFEIARQNVLTQSSAQLGIGTLNEKTLHAVLKQFYEPCRARHEIQLGPYVADIVGENGIIEIQTRAFHKLRDKLAYFLSISRNVTVVYPVVHTKWICWMDPENGAISPKRKSPKTGTVYSSFSELYKIKPLLKNPALHIWLPLLDVTEYKLLNSWSKDKKKGATRYDRIPEALIEEVRLDQLQDYRALLPACLEMPFTAGAFSETAGIPRKSAGIVLHIMNYIGAVSRVGKKGNQYLYTI